MKISVDLPLPLLKRAEAYAVSRGMSLHELLIEALELIVGGSEPPSANPGWESLFGAFPASEIVALQRDIDREFSKVELGSRE